MKPESGELGYRLFIPKALFEVKIAWRRFHLRRTVKAYISQGESHYIAECLEVSVVTQGRTLDETIANLKEAVALFLEGEDPAEFDLAPTPSLLVTLEVEPAAHAALA